MVPTLLCPLAFMVVEMQITNCQESREVQDQLPVQEVFLVNVILVI